MSDLKQYLLSVGKITTQKTYESIVLKHGRAFQAPAHPRPKGIRKGRNKLCYMNSYHLTEQSYRYVEGFAIANISVQIPLQHAWVIDERDNVIETTWPESGLEYYGIIFDRELVDKVMLELRVYGIMDFRSKTFRDKFG